MSALSHNQGTVHRISCSCESTFRYRPESATPRSLLHAGCPECECTPDHINIDEACRPTSKGLRQANEQTMPFADRLQGHLAAD
ncbi:hypothetical protein DOTSEDRAFT_68420 [Dothistroma septosporum NZE10]|uniref:Uncharacterized protein n=1 Tax=Dothistroma septosporum (strain NZE10 / CBS 128990) TaxID=675120 RepID=N1Q4C9_DOTSN|nr:hypothetical protein DOTSEDRAFT_68420 [Dothistroma septosporum NZE10]